MRFQNKIVVIATSGGFYWNRMCTGMLQGEGAKVVFLVSDKSETSGNGGV